MNEVMNQINQKFMILTLFSSMIVLSQDEYQL